MADALSPFSAITSVRRTDQSSEAQWRRIPAAVAMRDRELADHVRWMLESLAQMPTGFAANQLTHPEIAASIPNSCFWSRAVAWMSARHQDVRGRHDSGDFGLDPDLQERHRELSAYERARRFADEWDQSSFDPVQCLALAAFQMLRSSHPDEPLIIEITRRVMEDEDSETSPLPDPPRILEDMLERVLWSAQDPGPRSDEKERQQ